SGRPTPSSPWSPSSTRPSVAPTSPPGRPSTIEEAPHDPFVPPRHRPPPFRRTRLLALRRAGGDAAVLHQGRHLGGPAGDVRRRGTRGRRLLPGPLEPRQGRAQHPRGQ